VERDERQQAAAGLDVIADTDLPVADRAVDGGADDRVPAVL
jgi:hypothetical protein